MGFRAGWSRAAALLALNGCVGLRSAAVPCSPAVPEPFGEGIISGEQKDSHGSFNAAGEPGWSAPALVRGISSEASEYGPVIPPDGQGMYFTRAADPTLEARVDIFRMDACALDREVLRSVTSGAREGD